MSNRIPNHTMNEIRPLYDEEVAQDQPLGADLLFEMMRNQAALGEYLTDEAIAGNSTQTVSGHCHGRDGDGAYVARHGSFDIGHIYPQQTTETSYQPVYWEIFNTGGPSAAGVEAAGSRISLLTPSILLDRDYKELILRVLMKVSGDGLAWARLSLLDSGQSLASCEASCWMIGWNMVELKLSLPNDLSFTGWRQLKLELKSSSSEATAHICSDDARFKPFSGSLYNGIGLLKGE